MDKILDKDVLLLFLDYDGTLTPIVKSPEEATLSGNTRELLRELKDNEKIDVCVVSGRGLQDIKNLVRIPGIVYVGNHGFEAEGVSYEIPALRRKKTRTLINGICCELEQKLRGIKGAFVENKGLAASVHYRQAKKEKISLIKKRVSEIMSSYISDLKLAKGEKVLEIRPNVRWGKGKAVSRIYEEMSEKHPNEKIIPVYIGDDKTDEDAFNALEGEGVTILVSDKKKETGAKYRLENTKKVENLLKNIARNF